MPNNLQELLKRMQRNGGRITGPDLAILNAAQQAQGPNVPLGLPSMAPPVAGPPPPQDAQWGGQIGGGGMPAGATPGGMNQAAAIHAAALGAPQGDGVGPMPQGPMPQSAGRTGANIDLQNPNAKFVNPQQGLGPKQQMLRNIMLGGGIGSATNSPVGMGVGAGIGLLATLLARRKGQQQQPAAVPPQMVAQNAQGMKKGGVIRMAVGGAAKERKDFPNTRKPKAMKGNPVQKGMGKASRGHNFKGVF